MGEHSAVQCRTGTLGEDGNTLGGEAWGAHSDTRPENIKSSPFIKLQGRENIEQVKLGES